MKTSIVISAQDSNRNLVQSIVSVLENSHKANNICIVFNKIASEAQWETAKSLFKSCCGNNSFSEEDINSTKILKKENDGINLIAIKVNKLFEHDIKNFAIDYLYDTTDIFLTLTAGLEYTGSYIEDSIKAFGDDVNIGGVYSDYIENGKYKYLSSLHMMIDHMIPIKEIAFKKSIVERNPFKSDNLTLINEIYSKSIIKHIPKALLIT